MKTGIAMIVATLLIWLLCVVVIVRVAKPTLERIDQRGLKSVLSEIWNGKEPAK